jgi:poly-gamma-glutamate capsule biosynthesis protein CapA/YwtB (metallophosphatase superfamily)
MRLIHLLISVFFLCESFTGLSQELSFIFAGDVMQHGPQITAARNDKTDSYDYDASFQFVKPIIESKDIAIANLEVTHAGKPYAGYPQFSAPDELSAALQTAGFDVIITANNHSCDGGAKGVTRTLDILDALNIKHTGTFRNKAERDANYPLILNEKGMKVALLNYTYGTNGLSVAPPLIVNYIDSAVIRKDIKKAKELKADYIICTMHWGNEYESQPSAYQKKWEKFCYELGVDMIIGSHPHVVQPLETKSIGGENKLTAWSLGNYVSNQKDRYKNGGLMVAATLEKKQDKIELTNVEHSFHYVHIKQERGVKYYYMLPDFNYLSYRPDFMQKEDLDKMKEFFNDSRALFKTYSKGTTEIIIEPDDKIGELYQLYLKGYYTVIIENKADNKKPVYWQNVLKPYVNKLIYSDGSYAYTGEILATKEEAFGNLQFFKDCNIDLDMKVVFVTPEDIKEIKE